MPLQFGNLTPEEKAANLAKAKAARTARAELKKTIKEGKTTLTKVLAKKGDPIIDKTRVIDLLKAVPGIGAKTAEEILEKAKIQPNRKVKGLGSNQAVKLKEILEGK